MGPPLITMAQSAMWWLGDWMAYGERVYGEIAQQALDMTDLSWTTLRNYQWVAERIPPAERRLDIPFSHHRAVASLPSTERTQLLDRAKAENMTEGELRGRVRQFKELGAGPTPEPPPFPDDETLAEAVPHVLRALVQAEASRSWGDVRAATRRLEVAASREPVG
jgi:hypothetical protein